MTPNPLALAVADAHARLGPSNHTWPHCPGSIREQAAYQNIAGEAAIDGTGSHLLLEMCLVNGVRAEAYIGQIIGINHHDMLNGWVVHQDRVDRVQQCLDYITRRFWELTEQYPGAKITTVAEGKSDVGGMYGRTDWWGTVDITITVIRGDVCLFIEIIDYKDGRIYVHHIGNTQLISYGGGRARPYIASGPQLVAPLCPENIRGGMRLTIVQPKCRPTVRYDDVTTSYIVEELQKLKWAAIKTDDPNAILIPDDKGGKGYCRWCLHRDNCTASATKSLEVMGHMSNDIIPTGACTTDQPLFEGVGQLIGDVTLMTVDQLVQLADARAGIDAAFQRVAKEIEARINQDITVPGYAKLPGKNSNVWAKDDADIEKMLKARKWKKTDIFPSKMVSPAQVLASPLLTPAQKKRVDEDYIRSVPGKLTIKKVTVGSENNRVEKDVREMFKDVVHDDTVAVQSQPSDDFDFF